MPTETLYGQERSGQTAARRWGATGSLVGGAVISVAGTLWYYTAYGYGDSRSEMPAIGVLLGITVLPLLGRWPLSRARGWWTTAVWTALAVPGAYAFGVAFLFGATASALGLLVTGAGPRSPERPAYGERHLED